MLGLLLTGLAKTIGNDQDERKESTTKLSNNLRLNYFHRNQISHVMYIGFRFVIHKPWFNDNEVAFEILIQSITTCCV